MSQRLRSYLEQMQMAASDACQFVDQMSTSDLLDDKRKQQAVIIG